MYVLSGIRRYPRPERRNGIFGMEPEPHSEADVTPKQTINARYDGVSFRWKENSRRCPSCPVFAWDFSFLFFFSQIAFPYIFGSFYNKLLTSKLNSSSKFNWKKLKLQKESTFTQTLFLFVYEIKRLRLTNRTIIRVVFFFFCFIISIGTKEK